MDSNPVRLHEGKLSKSEMVTEEFDEMKQEMKKQFKDALNSEEYKLNKEASLVLKILMLLTLGRTKL